ncbi:MAG: class I SAM-dependent methyltransferase family protein [archaeon]
MNKLKGTPTSFDVIGDIAILEIPEEHIKNEKAIAEQFLKDHKNIKVVAKKVGIHSGKYRTQNLKIIAGEKRKTTLHKENGIRMELNVETSYFSPRSSTERARIAGLVKPKEEVLVMFSGVAPFPLVLAKYSKPKVIYAIEINPKAHEFAEKNVKLNKFDNIKLYLGDVKEVLPKLKKKFDRIVMPLPKTAEEFLPDAKKYAKKGATIHFYTFGQEKEFKEIKKTIKKVFPKVKTIKLVKCGKYAPYTFRVCAEFKAP